MNSSNASFTSSNCPGHETIYSFNFINLTNEIKSTWISLQVINGVAAPVTLVLNLLIIWVILEKENLRTNKSNVSLVALAFTDLLVSSTVQPIFIWRYDCLLRDGCQVSCEMSQVTFSFTRFLVLQSMTSLMVLSIERYIAVQRPFLYEQVTTKNVVISVIFMWSLSLVFSAISLSLRRRGTVNEFSFDIVFVVLHVLVTSYCSGKVQIAAYRQMKAIVAQAVAVLGQATEEQKKEHKKKYQESKKTVSFCMLVFSSFVMYSPAVVVILVGQLAGTDINPPISHPIVSSFVTLQSLVNPLITLRLSYIRKPVLSKVAKLFGISELRFTTGRVRDGV